MLLLFISPPQHIQSFLQLLKDIYVKAPHHCPTIFIGGFNVDMLKNTTSSKQLIGYMHQHKFVLTFLKSTTIYNSQLDHIWSNAILTTCQSRNIEVYCTDHRPICFIFKLPNHVSCFCFPNKRDIKC
jgi:hypothetical protein